MFDELRDPGRISDIGLATSATAHDVVRAVVRDTRRELGVAQPQKTALEIDALRTVIAAIPEGLRGLRDRALLLVGWAAALRRSELVALEVGDLSFEPEGVVLIDSALEDRSRGGGRERGGSARRGRRKLSGACVAPLARNRGDRRRARLSPDRSAWAFRADVIGSGAGRDRRGPRRRGGT
jgi:integrase